MSVIIGKTTIKTKWVHCAIIFLLAAFAGAPGFPQEGGEGFITIPTKDSVYIIGMDLPADGVAGYIVYRADKGSSDFKLITPEPVMPVRDSEAILALLGGEAAEFLENFEIESVDQLFDSYKKRKGMYNLFSIFSIELNSILGRLYVDGGVEPGEEYSYKIARVDDSGREIKSFGPREVAVRGVAIQTPTGFSVKAEDGGVTLQWDKAPEGFEGIGWDTYRAESKDGPFEAANDKLISILGDEDKEFKSFHDLHLVNGKTYYYYAAGRDLAGNTSEPTEILEATPVDMTPPMPPGNVKVELKAEGLLITWDMSLEPDVAYYEVFRGETQEGEFLKISEQPLPPDVIEFIDVNITEGAKQYYRLTATDKTGNTSDKSAAVAVIPPDKTPPSSPIQVAGRPEGNNMILITWEPNTDKDLKGYYLYRGMAPDGMKQINEGIIDGALTKYEDFTVSSGEAYYYSLAAVDDSLNISGTSTPIMVVAPDAEPPRAPAGFFVKAESGTVAMAWPANYEKDLAGYRIYRSDDPEAPEEKFAKLGEDIPEDSTGRSDNDVVDGRKYRYFLTAFDRAGNESERSTTAEVLPRDFVPPAIPEGLAGAPTEKNVVLTWKPGEEKDIAGYFVLRSETMTGVYKSAAGEEPLDKLTTTFIDDTLGPGQVFWYRVIAVDRSGNKSDRTEPAGPFSLVVPEPEGEGAKEAGEGKSAGEGDDKGEKKE